MISGWASVTRSQLDGGGLQAPRDGQSFNADGTESARFDKNLSNALSDLASAKLVSVCLRSWITRAAIIRVFISRCGPSAASSLRSLLILMPRRCCHFQERQMSIEIHKLKQAD